MLPLVLQGQAAEGRGSRFLGIANPPVQGLLEQLSGGIDVVRVLVLECQANVEAVNEAHMRPLNVACASNQKEVVRFLLLEGSADVRRLNRKMTVIFTGLHCTWLQNV